MSSSDGERNPLLDDEPVAAEVAEEDKSVWKPDPNATIPTTAVNITINVIGGGLLAIPDALSQASVVPGCFLLAVIGIVSIFCMLMLVLCAERTQRFSYKDILAHCFSRKAGRAFDVILFCYTFGLLVGYTRIIGDIMPRVAQDFFKAKGFFAHELFWILISAVVFFGLSSAQQLSGLWWSSYFGFATICYLGFMIAFRFAGDRYREPGQAGPIRSDVKYFDLTANFFQSIAVLATSFSCHYNLPSYYGEMKNRSPTRVMTSVLCFSSFTVPFYYMVGLLGLFMFGDAAIRAKHGDLMVNFSRHDVPINVARFGYFIQFLASFPLVCLACRRALNTVIFNQPKVKRGLAVLEAFILVVCSCTLAYLVDSIDVIFSVNGSLFGMAIVVIVPPFLYIRCFRAGTRNEPRTTQKSSKTRTEEAEAAAVAAATSGVNTSGGIRGIEQSGRSETPRERSAISNTRQSDGEGHVVVEDGHYVNSDHGASDDDDWEEQERAQKTTRVGRWLNSLGRRPSPALKYMCYGCSVLGAFFSISSFAVTIYNIIHKHH